MSERINLAFGGGYVELEYDPRALELLLPDPPRRGMSAAELEAAIGKPVGAAPLSELARGSRSALIVVSDATRIAGADLVLPLLLGELEEGGLGRDRVWVVIALGNHRRATPEELDHLLGPELAGSLQIEQHDSRDAGRLHRFGRTSRGTEVLLSRALLEHDLVITISGITAHYFAGFGGGRKSILPGLAGRETIVTNHLLAIDFDKGRLAEGVEPCRLEGNPVHEDMEEAVAKAPPSFAVSTLLTPDKLVGALWCGDWIGSHRAGCREFIRRHGVKVSGKRRVVIASCGGRPKDIDLIQSQKSIQYASRALEPGGTLVLLARCEEGIGNPYFRDFFPIVDLRDFLERLREDHPRNGHTALAFSEKAREFDIRLVSDLEPEDVEAVGFRPYPSLPAALADLDISAPATGYIIPGGADTIPLAE